MLEAAFAMVVAMQAMPAAPTVQSLSGTYLLSQMEMGGALALWPDGRFRYMLDYGAVSEAAQGKWRLAADGIHLTSEPLPREVLIEAERSDAGFKDVILRIDGDTLVMERYDTRMFFRRVQP